MPSFYMTVVHSYEWTSSFKEILILCSITQKCSLKKEEFYTLLEWFVLSRLLYLDFSSQSHEYNLSLSKSKACSLIIPYNAILLVLFTVCSIMSTPKFLLIKFINILLSKVEFPLIKSLHFLIQPSTPNLLVNVFSLIGMVSYITPNHEYGTPYSGSGHNLLWTTTHFASCPFSSLVIVLKVQQEALTYFVI